VALFISAISSYFLFADFVEALYITPGTVHVHAILHKLGVSDRHAAVMIAIQKQLIQSDS
jgi:ATP/maltotriose-dependent transcriptional regulator MalT